VRRHQPAEENCQLLDLAVRWQDDQPFPKSGSTVNVEAGVQLRF
jgi:hypothetical protein